MSVWRTGEDEDGTRHYWAAGGMAAQPRRFSLTRKQRRHGNLLIGTMVGLMTVGGVVGGVVGHHVGHGTTGALVGVFVGTIAPNLVVVVVMPFAALVVGVRGARRVATGRSDQRD